jgi:hypothetical protein
VNWRGDGYVSQWAEDVTMATIAFSRRWQKSDLSKERTGEIRLEDIDVAFKGDDTPTFPHGSRYYLSCCRSPILFVKSYASQNGPWMSNPLPEA